jgi:SAM-dependent methyltransferase
MTTTDFYDQLAPFYHLIFPDWEASIRRQAAALENIIQGFWPGEVRTILDVACGIGTQSLALASLGYSLTASDLSSGAIKRARREAQTRGLHIDFSVADMRQAYDHHQKQFDLVIACDNAVPHLLTDDELLKAFRQFYQCVSPGGGCLISVRDYDQEERAGLQVKPYGVRVEDGIKYLVFQVWEFEGMIYELSMYFVEDRGGANCRTRVMRTKYYAVGTDKLIALMREAGFSQVQVLAERFYQPVVIGWKS